MSEHVQTREPGEYRLTRALPNGRLAKRWLAVSDDDSATWVAHEFECGRGRCERRRLSRGLQSLSRLAHPHVLPVSTYWFAQGGRAWALTPYVGTQVGLVNLEEVLAEKGGRMEWPEARRVAAQLLEASAHAHAERAVHGTVHADEVLVDRHGCLLIEHYGVEAAIDGLEPDGELRRDEVRSIVQLTYRLVTGVSADEPRIPATRLVRRLERRWDQWFDAGLDPVSGFATASDALEQLPGVPAVAERPIPTTTVRGMLGRVRGAIGRSERA